MGIRGRKQKVKYEKHQFIIFKHDNHTFEVEKSDNDRKLFILELQPFKAN